MTSVRWKDLTDEIKRYKIALSPHKKLPADVWLHIFFQLCCLPTGFDGSSETSLSPSEILSQVCSGWQQLLMSSPAIWSSIQCLEWRPYSLSHAARLLSRAGNIPRSLRITRAYNRSIQTPFRYEGRPPYRLGMAEELVSLYPFRSLDIQFPIQFSKIPIESLLPLEELILCPGGQECKRTSLSPHSLPNLKCLIISGYVPMPSFHQPRPFSTWPNLRKLALHCWLPKFECLTILRDTIRIEECTMRVDSDGETRSIVEDIVLPRLMTLVLDFRPGRDLASFLDTLTLPNLTSLELHDGGCDEQTLHQLAKRSGMRDMKELTICEAETPLDVGVLLEIFPSLCHLEIYARIRLDKSTMHRIWSGELGPRLRTLHLQGSRGYQTTEFRQFTIRRQQLNQPKPISLLEKVSVEAYPHPLGKSQLSHDGIEFEVGIVHNIELPTCEAAITP